MRFAVLGPVTVGDGEQSQQLRGPRQRAVLALLLSDPARAVTADRMVTEIWGEGAGTGAVDSLYTHVSTLRRLLGKDRIDRDSSGYRLVLRDGDEIDAQVFEREVGEARRVAVADAAGAVEMFDTALSRWRGRPYEGLEDVPSLAAEISRLEGIHAAAEMDRIEALLQSGATPAAVEVEAICDRRPLDERPWSLLMRSLYRDGRQADALRTCTRVRELLGRELGIEPSPLLTGLEEQILLHDPALDAGTFDAPASLPSHLTSFVGRTDEQQHLAELLLDHRLITITGPGGVGKTRLGVELASASRARFPDGVWHVDLASCSDPTQIGSTIGAAVHIPGAAAADTLEHVAAALATKSVLVVLDNCEHLRQAAADVVETLLSRAPGLTILATSRRPLKIAGEQRYALEGLPVGTDEETIGDAERLFIERCSEIEPTQGGGDRPLRAIRAICEHLDGLPLALELAAGRSDVLSPPEISALLSRRFAILVDERQPRDIHRSLEATVGWSYGLLDPDERSAYAALGVFEGPFTIDAAAAVLGVDDVGDAVSRLERLVTASLVTVASGESDRTTFRLLETLRAYARDRLRESGRWPEAVGRHDEHYLAVCAGLREEFLGAGRVAATDRIAQELVDFLAVWDRGMLDDPTSVLPLAWPLGNYWLFGGRLGEGEGRLVNLLEATTEDDSLARADALTIAGFLLAYRNRMDQSVVLTAEAIGAYREAEDEKRLAYGLARGGHWAFATGDGQAAMEMLHESLEICDRIDYEEGRAWPTALIAQARRWSGDTDPEIRDLFLEARRRFIEMGEPYGQIHADMILTSFREFSREERLRFATEMVEISQRSGGESLMRPIAFHNLAYPVWEAGERERAEGLNRVCIRSAIATGAAIDLGLGLMQAARFAGESGEAERAATLFGAGETHFGMQIAPFQQEELAPAEAGARAQLGDAGYDELFRIGSAMTSNEAAAYALGESA